MAVRPRIGYIERILPEVDTVSPRDQLDRVLAIAHRIVRYWWVIALAVIAGGGVSVAFALTKKNLYQSESVILHRQRIRAEVVSGPDAIVARDDAGARLKETVLARSRLEAMIDQLDLYPSVVRREGKVAAVERMRQFIEFRSQGGDVFYISFLGESPDQAAQVTQMLAETLIEEERSRIIEEVTATKDFLERELVLAETELANRELALATFIDENREFATDLQIPFGLSIRSQEFASPAAPSRQRTSDPVLAGLFREQDQLQARKRELERRGARPDLVRERDLAEEELRESQSRLAELRQRFRDDYPDVRAARNKFESAQRRVSRARQAIQSDIEARQGPELRAIDRQLDDVRRRIEARRAKMRQEDRDRKEPQERAKKERDQPRVEAKPAAGSLVDLETQWVRIKREWEEARDRQRILKDKYERAAIDANSELAAQASQMSIIDEAYTPTRPAGAGKRIIVMAGTLVAGFLGFALALGLALIDDRIYNRRELERLGLLPVLVVVPKGPRGGRPPPAAASSSSTSAFG